MHFSDFMIKNQTTSSIILKCVLQEVWSVLTAVVYEYDQLSETRINYKFFPYLNMGARFCNVLKYAVSVLTRTEAFIAFMNHEIMFYIKYDW